MREVGVLEGLDKSGLSFPEVDINEKLASFNKNFTSHLAPENGIYGLTEVLKENGILERIGKNELGHTFKEYYFDGKITQRKEILGKGNNITTYFDDNAKAYLETTKKFSDNQAKVVSQRLAPNSEIVKGNFTAQTDAFGRPSLNRITDLAVKDGSRNSLNSVAKDISYRDTDHKGHIIGDNFNGPASRENVVPMDQLVNQGQFKKVENLVRDLKAQGHTIDYEVKINYTSSTAARPSSFEPSIKVDGEIYDLPDDLRKIYNDATPSTIKKLSTNIGEKYGIANEMGVKSGLIAAGITFTISSVDNISSYVDGQITADEMVVEILKDTGTAGALGYGSTFISTAISQSMAKSSSALISKVGGSYLPASTVAFAVTSSETVSDFAQGKIDGAEFAYEMADHAVGITGSIAGIAVTSAIIGSIVPGAGTAVGFAAGLVGGTVGCVIASKAYKTAIEVSTGGIEVLDVKAQNLTQRAAEFHNNIVDLTQNVATAVSTEARAFTDIAKTYAENTLESIKVNAPEHFESARTAFNDFWEDNGIPIKL